MTREPYPAAPREETVEILHGTPVPDPYRWLEDPAGAETEKWLLGQAELFKRESEPRALQVADRASC